MKRIFALLALAALILLVSTARGDQAEGGAREKLAHDGIAFTPEAFLQTVAAGDVKHTALFLEAGIDPSVKSPTGRTALWVATERRQLETLKALLAGGVAPNDQNAPVVEYGKTPRFEAVDTAKTPEMRALLEAAE
jgi:hypothetical protein